MLPGNRLRLGWINSSGAEGKLLTLDDFEDQDELAAQIVVFENAVGRWAAGTGIGLGVPPRQSPPEQTTRAARYLLARKP